MVKMVDNIPPRLQHVSIVIVCMLDTASELEYMFEHLSYRLQLTILCTVEEISSER